MKSEISECVFYHIYPLGLCGSMEKNDFCSPKQNCFEILENELKNYKEKGINTLYIGPVFESTSHGYDTVDYFHIDRRLGNNESFKNFCKKAHELGIKIILDAVFNHTGRDFFAFKDLQQNLSNSKYLSWYKNINFSSKSPYGDNFDYEGWAGNKDLVKLNVDNEEVQNHLFEAVKFWKNEFEIEGLRLDACDVLSKNFLEKLSAFVKTLDNDFYLMGEVVFGNYNDWISENKIDSVTNYELYKAFWSSFNSQNMFEISYSLNREFGENGIYKNKILYNFLDNHDVNRIASQVQKDEYLFPLYGLLFTVPGSPSIYYGSDLGIKGKRDISDKFLRPSLPPFAQKIPDFAVSSVNSKNLENAIKKFSEIRKNSNALKKGNYKELSVTNKAFAFMREFYGEKVIVAVNASSERQNLKINERGKWFDVLNNLNFENLENLNLDSCWLRILKQV